MQDAADCGRLYAVQFEFFDPRILLISDGWVVFEKDSVKRHVNSPYLRFFAKIAFGKLRAVSVGKTYRHLRFGGITSGTRVIGQKHDVPETQAPHIFYSIIIQPYHFGDLFFLS